MQSMPGQQPVVSQDLQAPLTPQRRAYYLREIAKRRRLTPEQSKFLKEFLKDWNKGEAAVRAGLKRTDGNRYFTNPRIQAAIHEAMDQGGLTGLHLASRLAQIAFGTDLADFEPWLMSQTNEATGQPWTLQELREQGIDTSVLDSVGIDSKGGRKLSRPKLVEVLMCLARLQGLVQEAQNQQAGGLTIIFNESIREVDKPQEVQSRIVEQAPQMALPQDTVRETETVTT